MAQVSSPAASFLRAPSSADLLSAKTAPRFSTSSTALLSLGPSATQDVSTFSNSMIVNPNISVATRFTNQGRVSAAIYDNTMQESPNRLNPNQVLRRERAGATDQNKEEAYRRENYILFQKNLALAFDQYNQAKGPDGKKD